MKRWMFALALTLPAMQPAAAAPFAVTVLTPEAIDMVDLGSLRWAVGTTTYRTFMLVQPSPVLAGGNLAYLGELREARCATGEVRRLGMSADIGDGEDMTTPIPEDPWTPLDPEEKRVVCEPTHRPQQVVPTLDAARTALISAAPPP